MAKKLIRFDWAMKKMLRHKTNFDILEGFLSELLSEEVKIKQFSEQLSPATHIMQPWPSRKVSYFFLDLLHELQKPPGALAPKRH